jgi:hypothetical protein
MAQQNPNAVFFRESGVFKDLRSILASSALESTTALPRPPGYRQAAPDPRPRATFLVNENTIAYVSVKRK